MERRTLASTGDGPSRWTSGVIFESNFNDFKPWTSHTRLRLGLGEPWASHHKPTPTLTPTLTGRIDPGTFLAEAEA